MLNPGVGIAIVMQQNVRVESWHFVSALQNDIALYSVCMIYFTEQHPLISTEGAGY